MCFVSQYKNSSYFPQRLLIGFFSGRIRKTAKATVSFVMLCVRLSVRTEQLAFQWADFHEILYQSILQKSVEVFQVSLQSDTNNGYFT
jgi:hypothetical protein